MRKISLIFAVAATFFMTGCALTVDKVNVRHTPQTGVVRVQGASDITADVQVIDARQDKSKVSSKKNGFGVEMAPIVAKEDVAKTFKTAIEQELIARGFNIGDKATVSIKADITRFYNDFKMGFVAGNAEAELNLVVAVKSTTGEVLYFKQIMAQGTEKNIQLNTGDNAELALNRAFDEGLKKIFDDKEFILALLKDKK